MTKSASGWVITLTKNKLPGRPKVVRKREPNEPIKEQRLFTLSYMACNLFSDFVHQAGQWWLPKLQVNPKLVTRLAIYSLQTVITLLVFRVLVGILMFSFSWIIGLVFISWIYCGFMAKIVNSMFLSLTFLMFMVSRIYLCILRLPSCSFHIGLSLWILIFIISILWFLSFSLMVSFVIKICDVGQGPIYLAYFLFTLNYGLAYLLGQ